MKAVSPRPHVSLTSHNTFKSSVYIVGPLVNGRIFDTPFSTPGGYTDPECGADEIGTNGSTPTPPSAVGGKSSSAGTTPYEAGGKPYSAGTTPFEMRGKALSVGTTPYEVDGKP